MQVFLKFSALVILAATVVAFLAQPLARTIRNATTPPVFASRSSPAVNRTPPPLPKLSVFPATPTNVREPLPDFIPPPEIRDGYPLTVSGETFVVGPIEHIDPATERRVERAHDLYPWKPPHPWMAGKYDMKYAPREPVIGQSPMLMIYLNGSTPQNPRWVLRYPRLSTDPIRPDQVNPENPSDRYYIKDAAVHRVTSCDGKDHVVAVWWKLRPRRLWRLPDNTPYDSQ